MFQRVLLALESERCAVLQLPPLQAEPFEPGGISQAAVPILLQLAQGHVVVGPLGTGDAGLDCRQIQLEDARVLQVCVVLVIFEKSQSAQILLSDVDLLLCSAGLPQVGYGLLVDGEQSDRGSVFGSHIADGGSIGKAQIFDSGAKEFHKFIDDSLLSEHLRAEKDEVGGG